MNSEICSVKLERSSETDLIPSYSKERAETAEKLDHVNIAKTLAVGVSYDYFVIVSLPQNGGREKLGFFFVGGGKNWRAHRASPLQVNNFAWQFPVVVAVATFDVESNQAFGGNRWTTDRSTYLSWRDIRYQMV